MNACNGGHRARGPQQMDIPAGMTCRARPSASKSSSISPTSPTMRSKVSATPRPRHSARQCRRPRQAATSSRRYALPIAGSVCPLRLRISRMASSVEPPPMSNTTTPVARGSIKRGAAGDGELGLCLARDHFQVEARFRSDPRQELDLRFLPCGRLRWQSAGGG
jgi:hypothetical protein